MKQMVATEQIARILSEQQIISIINENSNKYYLHNIQLNIDNYFNEQSGGAIKLQIICSQSSNFTLSSLNTYIREKGITSYAKGLLAFSFWGNGVDNGGIITYGAYLYSNSSTKMQVCTHYYDSNTSTTKLDYKEPKNLASYTPIEL